VVTESDPAFRESLFSAGFRAIAAASASRRTSASRSIDIQRPSRRSTFLRLFPTFLTVFFTA